MPAFESDRLVRLWLRRLLMIVLVTEVATTACGVEPPAGDNASTKGVEVATTSVPTQSSATAIEADPVSTSGAAGANAPSNAESAVSTSIPAPTTTVAVRDVPVADQVVRMRASPSVGIAEAEGIGLLHIDPECVILEVLGDQDLYTVLFDYRDIVSLDSPNGPITIQYWSPGDEPADTASAPEITIADGDNVTFAAPNDWGPEHLGDDTITLVTLPHESCPERFWLPGELKPRPTEEPDGDPSG